MRLLIVTGSVPIASELARIVEEQDDVTVVGRARGAAEALGQIRELEPDAVLLDLDVAARPGVDLAKALGEHEAPLVVFLASDPAQAVTAFELAAVDCILMPPDRARLGRALDRVRTRLAARSGRVRRGPSRLLAIRTRGNEAVIATEAIRWIEASGNYAILHVADGAYTIRRTLRTLEEQLDPARFVRVHRSHIVAVEQIREYRLFGDGDAEVVLSSGERLTVVRSRRPALERRMGGLA